MAKRVVPYRFKLTVVCIVVLLAFYGLMRSWRKYRQIRTNWRHHWDCGEDGCLPKAVFERSERVIVSENYLERVRGKIRRNEELQISIIGGSVTHGTGAIDKEGWAQLVASFVKKFYSVRGLNTTFKISPMPGSSATAFSLCPSFYVSNQTDLLIIELAYNSRASVLPDEVDPDLEDIIRYLHPSTDVLFVNYGPGVQHLSHSRSSEAHIEKLARHYDVGVISWLAAVGFYTTGTPRSGPLVISKWIDSDQIHPNSKGHRLLAELCLDYLFKKLSVSKVCDIREARPPRKSSEIVTQRGAGYCYSSDSEDMNSRLPVASTNGFVRRSDRPDGSKIGYISTRVGDNISFTVPLKSSSIVSIGYLVSYSKMGSFRISCSQGCSCQSLNKAVVDYPILFPYPVVDSFVKCKSFDCLINHVGCDTCLSSERKASTLEFAKFIASPVANLPCTVSVENYLLCESGERCRGTGDEKVKLMKMSVSPLPSNILGREPVVVNSDWLREYVAASSDG